MVGMFLLPKMSISNDHLILGGGPLEAGRRELVGGEGAGAGGEAAGDDDSLLAVPGAVLRHHVRVRADVLHQDLDAQGADEF